jgi:hypothetical protein
MTEERQGTVFIAEEIEDFSWLSGKFSAHWQSGSGSEFREGPRGVPAAEALAWGREQADRVLIRLADSDVYHSAGRVPPSNPEIPPWPEGRIVRPRRRQGMEHLDLKSEQPIAWRVRLPHRVSRERTTADVERLRGLLNAHPAVAALQIDVERGDQVDAVCRFSVFARSHREAMDAVLEIDQHIDEGLPFPIDELPDGQEGAFVVHMDWNPMDDIRPADPV